MIALGLAAVLCIAAAITGVFLLFKKAPAKAAVWNGTAATSFNGGNGTSGNPYQIATGEQLKYLANLVNSSSTNSTYGSSSVYYKLTANIELNNTTNWTSWTNTTSTLYGWVAIGTYDYRFKANFDGCGFVVSGIFRTVSNTNNRTDIGLFGCCDGAKISNLGVEKSYLYASIQSSTNHCFVGGIVASSYNDFSITNCYNTGTVISGNSNASAYAGGIVGYNSGTVTNCYNTGTITNVTTYSYYVGGICNGPGTIISSYWLSGSAPNVGAGRTITTCYSFDTSGNVATKGGTLMAALNEWVTANNSSLNYYYWKNIPYPTSTGSVYNTYTITYSYNGATGNNTTTSATVTYGSSYTLVVPICTGFTFTGWWTATSGGTQYTNASGSSLAVWSGTANITLYAQWTANTYTLTYSYNNATGNNTTASATVTYNASYSLVVPTRTGYSFIGWWSSTSGGTQYTNASGASLASWTGTSSITIYAQWNANTYTLTYSYNNATGNNTTASATVTYNASYNLVVPTRTGYTFTGWWSATSGGTQYTNASGASLANWTGTAGITIYAQWTANTYTLTYNYNNATGNNSTASATVTYNASYNLVVPTRTGYAFTGWWSATSGGTQYTNASGASLANWTGTAGITIYAQWTANTYTLTYNYNNATGNNTTASATVTYDSPYTLIVPTRTGYSFTGWWSATSGGTQYTNSSGVSLVNWTGTAGINIYAQWTGYNHTVRFNANNGSSSTSTQSFVYGTAQTLTANPYTKENFKFMGWATSQSNADNGTVTYTNSQSVNELTTTNNGTVDLYAVWSTNFATYYLYYNTGVSNDGNSGYVTPGVAIALPGTVEMAAYAPTGMTFAGWYENADLTGTAVTQVLISTAGTVNYYYAKWV